LPFCRLCMIRGYPACEAVSIIIHLSQSCLSVVDASNPRNDHKQSKRLQTEKTYQIPKITWKPAAFAAGRISAAVLQSLAAYILTILLTVLIVLKSSAQSALNLHVPSAFLFPIANPRFPAAETTDGAIARTAGRRAVIRMVMLGGRYSTWRK
jgi:hypothetical protein